jgi:hypothetical protein
VHRAFVRRELDRIFDYRARACAASSGGGSHQRDAGF